MNSLKNNKLSKKENKKILDNAKASLAVDGFIVTESETKLLEDFLEGIITLEDILKIIANNQIQMLYELQ